MPYGPVVMSMYPSWVYRFEDVGVFFSRSCWVLQRRFIRTRNYRIYGVSVLRGERNEMVSEEAIDKLLGWPPHDSIQLMRLFGKVPVGNLDGREELTRRQSIVQRSTALEMWKHSDWSTPLESSLVTEHLWAI